MRGSNVCGRNAIPCRVITDLGQVSENDAHPSTKQRCHVLHKHVVWSYHANATHHLPPKPRTAAGNSGAFASVADVLAGKSSVNDADVFGEAGAAHAEGKAADSREEVDLRVTEEVFIRDDFDVPLIHHPFRQQTLFDAFAQHRGAIGVVFAVKMHASHHRNFCGELRQPAGLIQTHSVRFCDCVFAEQNCPPVRSMIFQSR